jgi:DNA-binding CsgD family transcriptional regulator
LINLDQSSHIQTQTASRTEAETLGDLPNAPGHLLELLEETDRLMNQVQTFLQRVGAELKRLGVSPSMLPPSSRPPACPEVGSLSPRESEVVNLLVEGHRVSTIARSLFISQHTVRNHLHSVYRKLEVSSQAELIEQLKGAGRPSSLPAESPSCG